ncbi:hypothetical protein AB0G49_13875 [Streptomyces longwoodensis]|uniref:hypothetical protein n=1 Tax=Streptomyces longwoodensis TaxID=68231 RepID=UPI00340938B5
MRTFLAGLACGAVSGFLTYSHTGGDARAAGAVAVIVAVLAWCGVAYAVIDLGE